VFVARNQITGQMRAVKRLPYRKQEELVAIDAECRTLVRLGHPHIMKFYEFYREPNAIYLVTELCTGGTFTQFFRDGEWDVEDARILFQQIISAIHHCHKLRVLHHDLKPENCLMLRDTGRPFAKVIDFGIATIMQKSERPNASSIPEEGEEGEEAPTEEVCKEPEVDDEDTISKVTGSPFWRAPEVLDPDAKSGPKADLYSIGLIMFYCLTGTHPLHHGSWLVPMGATESLEMYDEMPMDCLGEHDIPDEAQELIRDLLEKDKQNRLSAKDALDHAWFDTDSQVGKVYPETPKNFLGGRQISYSCLSDVASPGVSPGCSPKTSPKGSPSGSPKSPKNPWGSPRKSSSKFGSSQSIIEEEADPHQGTTPTSSAPPAYMCSAHHPLKSFETDEDGYSCSKCENEFPEGSTLHGCRICDFDACSVCVKTLPVKETIGSLLARPKRRVRLGISVPKESFSLRPKGDDSPTASPKDTKFRQKRNRRGSMKSALLLDRVLRYKDLEPWHCAVLRLIAHNSHESDVAKQRERFFRMDKDKSGAVSREELKAAMDENGNLVNEDQLEGIFLNLDSQGTGEIEYNEWIASTLAPSIIRQEEVMKPVFDFLDTKHRGCVGLDELKVVLGADTAQAMLRRAGVREFEMDSFMKLMKAAAAD